MNAVTKIEAADPLARLREPFPAHQVSKLPKETKSQADQRKAEQNRGNWPAICKVCGGRHHPQAVHLDYVGHAALTDRLLDVDPSWTWEPVAFGQDGLPAIDRAGGLWIKLTVCGVTRLGYGSADGKQGGDAVKELIGDALRNAAMRCFLCGFKMQRGLTREHVWPKAAGGREAGNILLAHRLCNEAKEDRMPHPCELLYRDAIYLRGPSSDDLRRAA